MENNSNDLILIDTLFSKTLQFYNGDVSETLLALTFATIPFYEIPLVLPIINDTIYIPLPTVEEKLFKRKTKKLPSNFLIDSPTNSFGDKDKLAHFFGNAFLSNNVSFFNFSKFMGILVEVIESAFKVEGGLDYRDISINELGAAFGEALEDNNKLMPSDFINIYNFINQQKTFNY